MHTEFRKNTAPSFKCELSSPLFVFVILSTVIAGEKEARD